MDLYEKDVPKTVRNFKELCTDRTGTGMQKVVSIASFHSSCVKAEISRRATAPAENPSMEQNLRMRISSTSIPAREFCRWPIAEQTRMDHSSSCAPLQRLTSTGNMLCSGKSPPIPTMLLRRSKPLEAEAEKPLSQ